MTRFLSRALAELESGGVNKETERLFAYHHATKHSYHTVRTNAHFLDWRNQPDPFRTYEGATLVTLPAEPDFPVTGTFATMAALVKGIRTDRESKLEYQEEVPLDVVLLSRLLWHSMAISAWKKVPRTGERYSLRVNPSSGNLHPTETYLVLLGFMGINDGLYHYRAGVTINGCTWGGSTIKRDIVAARGLRLEFGNTVLTTRIKQIRVIRAQAQLSLN